VITFTTFALIAAQPNTTSLPWYAVVLLVVSIVATLVFLVIVIIYFRRYIIFLLREYQKPPTMTIASNGTLTAVARVFPLHGFTAGREFRFTTQNEKNFKYEYNQPIQAIHFTKPVDKIVRLSEVPVLIDCESSFWCRLRNRILGIPAPRIVIKQFTENGFIWDEENTYGVDGILELTIKSPQL